MLRGLTSDQRNATTGRRRDPRVGILGLAAGFLAVCCAIPSFLAAGLVVSTTVLLVGAEMAAVTAIGLAVGGWMRHRRRCCRAEDTTGMRP